jgi:membrane associated rhomboid family serine protease
MLPLSDDNPRAGSPIVTVSIIALCVLVFLWEALTASEAEIVSFALIPARLFGGSAILHDGITAVPAWATILTSLFLHGGVLHLGSNMLFLWIFGDNIEDAMGRLRFVFFYLTCGVASCVAQVAADPGSTVPIVGASGAIAGVLGAYIMLYPQANVRTLVFLGPFITVVRIPALIVLGLWFVIQFAVALTSGGVSEGVAVWAHVGGFVAGVALVPLLKRSDVALFQPARFPPFSRETN